MLVGHAALGGSAIAFVAGADVLVYAFALRCSGLLSR